MVPIKCRVETPTLNLQNTDINCGHMCMNSDSALEGKQKGRKTKPNLKTKAKELHVTDEPAGKAL